MQLKYVGGADIKGKRVLLRAGLNVPVSGGRVVDSFRIEKALTTVRHLLDRGAFQVVVLGHVGRGGESIEPIAVALATLLPGVHVHASKSIEAALSEQSVLRPGSVLLLPNVRTFVGETENDLVLAQKLAALGDVFVMDAFADAHRAHASVVGVATLLPSYAGLLVAEEVQKLTEALSPTHPALAVVGGAKFETKEPLVEKLLSSYERVCVGGAIVNDFFKACGYEVGQSLISQKIPAKHILENQRIELPNDVVVLGDTARTTTPTDVHANEKIVDAGPATGERWAEYIRDASFVLWNGPLGVYEKGFNTETERLAAAIAASKAYAVVGGGDTVAAVRKTHFDPDRVFLSTGGGAMLEFLAKGTLPGLEPLRV